MSVFFFNDTATTEIYTLSYTTLFRSQIPCSTCGITVSAGSSGAPDFGGCPHRRARAPRRTWVTGPDRKSTRLNSSHLVISYAVFCLKKKKNHHQRHHHATSHYPVYTH